MRILSQSGFTLLETVIVSILALIVGIALVSILVNNTDLFYKEGSIVKSGVNMNDVLQTVSDSIQESSSVVTGYPERSPIYISASQTLVLKLASTDSSGSIPNTFDYVVFTKDPDKPYFRMKTFPNPLSTRHTGDQILTTLLDAVEFTYLDKLDNQVPPGSATKVRAEISVLIQHGFSSTKQSSNIVVSPRNFL